MSIKKKKKKIESINSEQTSSSRKKQLSSSIASQQKTQHVVYLSCGSLNCLQLIQTRRRARRSLWASEMQHKAAAWLFDHINGKWKHKRTHRAAALHGELVRSDCVAGKGDVLHWRGSNPRWPGHHIVSATSGAVLIRHHCCVSHGERHLIMLGKHEPTAY